MERETDARLAKAARGGDKDAFSRLVERHYGAIYGLAYASVGNWSAAEDIAQEAFLVAYANLRRLRVPGVFLMWLRRIVRNLSQDWIRSEVYRRKLAERMKIEGEHNSVSNDSPAAHLGRQERYSEAWDALQTLSSNVREAMVLFYIEGKSTAEAAHSLGVTENAVRTRLYQGRKKLREHLETRIEAELKQGPPDSAAERILAALALGPAMPQLGHAAAGAGLGIWIHHLGHGGANVLLKMVLSSAASTKVAAGTAVIALMAAGVYFGAMTSRNQPPTAQPGDILHTSVVEQTEESPSFAETVPELEQRIAATLPEVTESPNLDRPEPEPGEILDPAQYCSIAGTITDDLGEPIPDARVIVIAPGYESHTELPYAYHDKFTDRSHHFHATTNRTGEYVVTGIRFVGETVVEAHADGYVVGRVSSTTPLGHQPEWIRLAPGDTMKNVDITLGSDPLFLKGRIRAADGSPVADAIVCSMGSWNAKSKVDCPALVYTDESGDFSIGYRPDIERCNLEMRSTAHGRYTFTDIPVDDEEVELWFGDTSTLTGTVTYSDDRPAAGLVVLLGGGVRTPMGPRGAFVRAFATEYTAVVDSQGRYLIPDIDPGQAYYAMVATRDRTPLTAEQRVDGFAPGDSAVWDCVLHSAIVIRGRVLGEQSGKSLADVCVRCEKNGKWIKGGNMFVNADGSYEFHLLTGPGTYSLYATYEDRSSKRLEDTYGKNFDLRGGENITIDLTLPDPFTHSFRVVDAYGNPISGARINRGPGLHRKATDKDGRVSWSGFEPDREAYVCISHPDFVSARSPRFVGQPGEVLPEETIMLYRQSGVAGVALDEHGNAISNTLLIISAYYDGDKLDGTGGKTDSQGAFLVSWGVPTALVTFEMTLVDESHIPRYFWISGPVECVAGHIMDFGEIVFSPAQEQTGDDK